MFSTNQTQEETINYIGFSRILDNEKKIVEENIKYFRERKKENMNEKAFFYHSSFRVPQIGGVFT